MFLRALFCPFFYFGRVNSALNIETSPSDTRLKFVLFFFLLPVLFLNLLLLSKLQVLRQVDLG